MQKSLLSAQQITKTFTNEGRETQVLYGVDLDLNEGESLSIIGGSGAGKSTLLQILGTLDQPSSGQVFFNGHLMSDFAEPDLAKFRNQNLGFIFQFHYLLNEFDALENVAMPARIAGESKSVAESKAAELLNALGLGSRLTHYPNQLSGGEQQRVAIARALMMEPKLLLADEPTGNLDKQNTENIKNLFLKVVSDFKVGLVVVTHDLSFASDFDRSRQMKDGRWV